MKIIKRNGSEETFDIQKIVVAVTKADKDNGERTLTDSQIEDIAEYVEFKCNKLNRAVSVEEIQDMVENQIMATGAFELARKYVRYRYKRSLVRKGEYNRQSYSVTDRVQQRGCKAGELKQEPGSQQRTERLYGRRGQP